MKTSKYLWLLLLFLSVITRAQDNVDDYKKQQTAAVEQQFTKFTVKIPIGESEKNLTLARRAWEEQKIQAKHGQKVNRGQVIGSVVNTGISSHNHIHCKVRKIGDAYDPTPFIKNYF